LLIFIAALSAAPIWAKPPNVGPIPPLEFTPPHAERVLLTNGVTAYLLVDHELPLLSVKIKMKMTPADEPARQAGLLSTFSQLWRAGGAGHRSPDELNAVLEYMATSIETSVASEEASVSLSCLSKNTTASFELFSDVLLHPRFDETQLSLIKDKTREGLRRKNDDPANVGRRALRDVVFGEEHVYARETTEETLKTIQRADLIALHGRVIVPDAAYVVVNGDFNRDEMIAQLETLFRPWRRTGRTIIPYDFSLKNPAPGPLFVIEKDVNQSRVLLARVGVARHDPDHFRLALADYILGGGGTSRLFGQIRSRLGLAYVVGSFVTEPTGPGMIGVGAQTKAASTVDIIRALQNELDRFCAEAPAPAELQLAKDSIINSHIFRFDSTAEIAEQQANLELYGYPADYLETYLDNIRAVKAADVLSTAKKYYAKEGMKTIVVGSEKRFVKPLTDVGPVTKIPLETLK
jgi:predicted Zn-dependent peptidase